MSAKNRLQHGGYLLEYDTNENTYAESDFLEKPAYVVCMISYSARTTSQTPYGIVVGVLIRLLRLAFVNDRFDISDSAFILVQDSLRVVTVASGKFGYINVMQDINEAIFSLF